MNVSIWGQTSDLISTGDQLYFLQPVLGGHPVLSGHLAIPWRWPLNTLSTVLYFAVCLRWIAQGKKEY